MTHLDRILPWSFRAKPVASIASITMLTVTLSCVGLGTAGVARAAGPPATPPALPAARAARVRIVPPATPPALPVESPASVYPGWQATGRNKGMRQARTSTSSSAAPARHLLSDTPASPNADGTLNGLSLLGLITELVIVVALLFIALRAVIPRSRGTPAGVPGAMVLHNESLGDKNRTCLLDLGERVVLVGISPAGMTTLATIDDPEEIKAVRTRYSARPAAHLKPRGERPRPTLARALRNALARTASLRPGAGVMPTIPRMSTASDIAYTMTPTTCGARRRVSARPCRGRSGTRATAPSQHVKLVASPPAQRDT